MYTHKYIYIYIHIQICVYHFCNQEVAIPAYVPNNLFRDIRAPSLLEVVVWP